MILLILLVYALFVYIELVPLYRNKQWHNFWVNACLTAISFAIALLLNFGIKIPSPAEPIKMLITSMVGQ